MRPAPPQPLAPQPGLAGSPAPSWLRPPGPAGRPRSCSGFAHWPGASRQPPPPVIAGVLPWRNSGNNCRAAAPPAQAFAKGGHRTWVIPPHIGVVAARGQKNQGVERAARCPFALPLHCQSRPVNTGVITVRIGQVGTAVGGVVGEIPSPAASAGWSRRGAPAASRPRTLAPIAPDHGDVWCIGHQLRRPSKTGRRKITTLAMFTPSGRFCCKPYAHPARAPRLEAIG